MEKKEVSYEESMELDKAVEFLESVAAALKNGKYVIEKEGKTLAFEPEGEVKLEVEVKHKKSSQELEIELTWKLEGEEEEEGEEAPEEKEATVAAQEIKTVEVPEAGRDKAGIAKMLSVAGLAAASAAIYSFIRWKKTAKAEEAESAAEEEQQAQPVEEDAEAGEKALGKSRKKVRELIKR